MCSLLRTAVGCLHALNKQLNGDQSENLFRALRPNNLEENKADLATNLPEDLLQNKAESLAGNGEVFARGGFLDPVIKKS